MDMISGGFRVPSAFELGFLVWRLHEVPPNIYTREATSGRTFARWVDPRGGAKWAIPVADLSTWPVGWPPDPFAGVPAAVAAVGLPGSEGFGAKNQGLGAAEEFLNDLGDSAGEVAGKIARGAGKTLGVLSLAVGKAAGGAAGGLVGGLASSPYALAGAVLLVVVGVVVYRRA